MVKSKYHITDEDLQRALDPYHPANDNRQMDVKSGHGRFRRTALASILNFTGGVLLLAFVAMVTLFAIAAAG